MSATLTIDTDAVLWSAPAAERAGRPLLVLMHGYVSNEQDNTISAIDGET